MHWIIERPDGDVRGALVGVLRAVLAGGMVEALLVPLRHPAGDALAPALVKDLALLDLADPLAPVLPLNGARLVSMLTQRPPRPRIAAVLRNCEIRALVELVKLQQASLEGLVLIGIECTGTYEVQDYARIARGEPRAAFALRPACQMCEYPAPAVSEAIPGLEMVIQQIGLAGSAALHVETSAAWAGRLGLTVADDAGPHDEALRRLLVEHSAARDRMLAEVRARTASPAGLAAFFSTCIRCHNMFLQDRRFRPRPAAVRGLGDAQRRDPPAGGHPAFPSYAHEPYEHQLRRLRAVHQRLPGRHFRRLRLSLRCSAHAGALRLRPRPQPGRGAAGQDV
jgi:formate dehydrogenase subunit beta